MSETNLPSVCPEHPKARIRHHYDQDFFSNGHRLGTPVERNHRYECAECGLQLCSPEEYKKRGGNQS